MQNSNFSLMVAKKIMTQTEVDNTILSTATSAKSAIAAFAKAEGVNRAQSFVNVYECRIAGVRANLVDIKDEAKLKKAEAALKSAETKLAAMVF